MKNSELLLKHYQYRSDAYACKGNIMHIPWSETDNDFVDSITNADFIEILEKDPASTTESDYGRLVELYNEEWVLNYLVSKNISVKKIPETDIKTPDFECSIKKNGTEKKFFIELKSLDICDGSYGHDQNNEEALKIVIKEEEDIKKNPQKGFYSSIQVPNNFANKLDCDCQRASLIEILIEKIENNLKKEQFSKGPTFLFVMIDRLCPGIGSKEDLVSYYFDGNFSVVSGLFWTVCFANVGHLVLKKAEFEGKSNIERPLKKQGILINRDYIAGVMFGYSFFKKEKKVFGIYDGHFTFDNNRWTDLDTVEVFSNITNDYSDKENETIAWKVNKKIQTMAPKNILLLFKTLIFRSRFKQFSAKKSIFSVIKTIKYIGSIPFRTKKK